MQLLRRHILLTTQNPRNITLIPEVIHLFPLLQTRHNLQIPLKLILLHPPKLFFILEPPHILLFEIGGSDEVHGFGFDAGVLEELAGGGALGCIYSESHCQDSIHVFRITRTPTFDVYRAIKLTHLHEQDTKRPNLTFIGIILFWTSIDRIFMAVFKNILIEI